MLINVLCNLPEQLEAALEAVQGAAWAADGTAFHEVERSADHVAEPAQAGTSLRDEKQSSQKIFGEIMIESAKFPESELGDIVRRCHEAGCGCRLALPYIFRDKAESWFARNKQTIADARFDGYLVRSLSEFSVVKEILDAQRAFPSETASDMKKYADTALIKTDYNMYAMNRGAKQMLRELGAGMLTAPVELNEKELHILNAPDMEMLVFGRIPMMISAQCLKSAAFGCENRKNVQIKDRTGKVMPVENVCPLCYNLVYNAVPLSMIGVKDKILRLSPQAVRLSFTVEDGASCRNILKAYADAFGGERHVADQGGRRSRRSAAERNEGRGGNGGSGRTVEEPVPEYTRGHFSRGVE